MKFAVTGIGSGCSNARPELLVEVAQKAEALGFESVWIPEHLAVPVELRSPYPYSADGKFPGGQRLALHDPFVALAFAAACTTRIKLGTGVFVLPLRNALAVAKAVASLDVLSNGRFLFGVGIGWLEDEFDAVGMPFKDRAARAREAVRMMKPCGATRRPSSTAGSTTSRRSASIPSRCRSHIRRSSSAASARGAEARRGAG